MQQHTRKTAANLADIIEQRGNLVGDHKSHCVEFRPPGLFEHQHAAYNLLASNSKLIGE